MAYWSLRDVSSVLCDDEDGVTLLLESLVEEFSDRLRRGGTSPGAGPKVNSKSLVILLQSVAFRFEMGKMPGKCRGNCSEASVKTLLVAAAECIVGSQDFALRKANIKNSGKTFLSTFRAQDIALTAWAYATLRPYPDGTTEIRLFKVLLEALESAFLRSFWSKDYEDQDGKRAREKVDFVSQNLSNLSWALARLNVNSEDRFFPTVGEAFLKLSSGADRRGNMHNIQNLANLAWAFASMSVDYSGLDEFYDMLWNLAGDVLGPSQSVVELSFDHDESQSGRGSESDHFEFRAWELASVVRSQELGYQNVANLAWALAVFLSTSQGSSHAEPQRLTASENKVLLGILRWLAGNFEGIEKKGQDKWIREFLCIQFFQLWLCLKALDKASKSKHCKPPWNPHV